MKRSGYYTLIGHTPVPERDVLKWARWYGKADEACIVARTEIPGGMVSTVFLGLDHNFSTHRKARPLLFETMVFRDGESCECERCSTWLEAEALHQKMVLKCLEDADV